MIIAKRELNARFFHALDAYSPTLKHLSTGSNGKHPLLRSVLLTNFKDDIATDGIVKATWKWRHFLGLSGAAYSPANIPSITPATLPAHNSGIQVNIFTGKAPGGQQLGLRTDVLCMARSESNEKPFNKFNPTQTTPDTRQELTQAVPWVYTLYLGSQLMRFLEDTT